MLDLEQAAQIMDGGKMGSTAKPRTSARRRLATGVLGATLVLGGVVATTAPAVAAGSGYATRTVFYSEAGTETSGGTEGRSYAKHGNVSVLTPWFNQWSHAYASVGLWGLGEAWYEFR